MADHLKGLNPFRSTLVNIFIENSFERHLNTVINRIQICGLTNVKIEQQDA